MIESVRRQTYADFELLLIDDGSSDETPRIIDGYVALDQRIVRVGDSSKLGKVGAFNLGFEKSAGELVVFLGGDDILPDDSLQQRVAAFSGKIDPGEKTVGFFRLRTFSAQKKFDNMVLPKVGRGNRSGGTLMMSRALSDPDPRVLAF